MNRKIKRFSLLLTIVVLVAMTACGTKPAQTTGSTPTEGSKDQSEQQAAAGDGSEELIANIGVISYLSGDGIAYGKAITNGLKLAQEEINNRYKGKLKILLIIEDSGGIREQAMSAAQKLIRSDNVVAIIGPTLSSEMFVVGPEADDYGVPIMGTSTTAEGIPQIGDYVFRNALPESLAIPAAIKKAVEKYGIKKVALIYGADDDFTRSGFETMKATAQEMGLKILKVEKFNTGDIDFNAQLASIKEAEPDAIFASALYKEGGFILKQARFMGLNVPVVGGNGFNSPQVIKQAGPAADGVIVASPWFPELEMAYVRDFVKKFEAKYGKKPDQFAAQAYDGLYIMAQAILDAGVANDRFTLRDSLADIRDFNGVTGKFSFDEWGNPIMNPVVLIIKDGKFMEFK